MKTPHQQFSIEDGDNYFSICQFDRSVYDQHVLVEYTSLLHGVSFHAKEIGGGFVAYQFFVEIDAAFHIVIGSGTKTRRVRRSHFLLGNLFYL